MPVSDRKHYASPRDYGVNRGRGGRRWKRRKGGGREEEIIAGGEREIMKTAKKNIRKMKKKGAYCDFTQQRNEELLRAYRRCAQEAAIIVLPQLLEQTVRQPCSRFWVSPQRATEVIGQMMQGNDATATMRPLKKAMYKELFARACRIREKFPTMGIFDITVRAVYSPAPQFYIAPSAAKIYLHYMKAHRAAPPIAWGCNMASPP